jgi:hypothetical protein
MPRAQYPFVTFEYPDGQLDSRGHTYVPVRISNPRKRASLVTYALIDTGADACLFPADLAVELGHDLKGRGVKASVTSGIEQTRVATYKHTVRLERLSADLRRTVWRSRPIEVDCAESNPPVLLGVEGVLDHFKLTIDYPKRIIRFHW